MLVFGLELDVLESSYIIGDGNGHGNNFFKSFFRSLIHSNLLLFSILNLLCNRKIKAFG